MVHNSQLAVSLFDLELRSRRLHAQGIVVGGVDNHGGRWAKIKNKTQRAIERVSKRNGCTLGEGVANTDEMTTLACWRVAEVRVMGEISGQKGEMMSEMMDQMSSLVRLFSLAPLLPCWAPRKPSLLRNGGAVPFFFAHIVTLSAHRYFMAPIFINASPRLLFAIPDYRSYLVKWSSAQDIHQRCVRIGLFRTSFRHRVQVLIHVLDTFDVRDAGVLIWCKLAIEYFIFACTTASNVYQVQMTNEYLG